VSEEPSVGIFRAGGSKLCFASSESCDWRAIPCRAGSLAAQVIGRPQCADYHNRDQHTVFLSPLC
jgi:hypothetical protein